MTNVAVLTRGTHDEAPYLNEFVNHYYQLGFSSIYIVNTSIETNWINEQLSNQLQSFVKQLEFEPNDSSWQQDCLAYANNRITEDWVLNIDMDEFISLNGIGLADFIDTIPKSVACVNIPWHVYLSDNYHEVSALSLLSQRHFGSRLFKSIYRRKAAHRIGVHNVELKYGSYAKTEEDFGLQLSLCHFACRGYFDLMNRIIDRSYFNAKSGRLEEQKLATFFGSQDRNFLDDPFRFNLYRYQKSFEHETKAPIKPMLTNSHTSDKEVLCGVTLAKLKRLGLQLDSRSIESLTDEIDTRFALKRHILSNIPDPTWSRLHLADELSYVNATKAWLEDAEGEGM